MDNNSNSSNLDMTLIIPGPNNHIILMAVCDQLEVEVVAVGHSLVILIIMTMALLLLLLNRTIIVHNNNKDGSLPIYQQFLFMVVQVQ